MAKRESSSKHRIVRSAIREDLLFALFPALLLFFFGLIVSMADGYEGMVSIIRWLVREPGALFTLQFHNFVGLLLIFSGFAIAFTGVGTLRRFYSSTLIIREDHQLITHGIYRYTRHPIYLGVTMIIIGIPVYTSSLKGLMVMAALIAVIQFRIRIEERLLTEEFGEAYLAYKETTNKLIPFIY